MTTLHQYRDCIITVEVTSSSGVTSSYSQYAKELVEVCQKSGHVFILGYMPIGIDTLSVATLTELFPHDKWVVISPDELITEFLPKPATSKKKRPLDLKP